MIEGENQFTRVSSNLHTYAVARNLLPQYRIKTKEKKARWCVIKEDSSYHIRTGKHTLTYMHTQACNIHIYITNKK